MLLREKNPGLAEDGKARLGVSKQGSRKLERCRVARLLGLAGVDLVGELAHPRVDPFPFVSHLVEVMDHVFE